ncbi:response regulator [Streptosporangium sp. NPDC000396]|uniref:response regulator n=1 Tax=Streptosporangium sp. NPDC000396 TaxID=3366185 RepID=UPI00368E85A3
MLNTAEPTRILLVDDHMLFRQGLQELLDTYQNLTVVGAAANSEQAIRLVEESRPDVVLLDVSIPGDEVTVTAQRILDRSPQSRVIVLSMYDDPQLVQAVLALGVNGYLLKSISRDELVAAICTVMTDPGRVVLSVSRISMEYVSQTTTVMLSEREREVLLLVAHAFSNAQIANRLSISQGTVKRHLRNIFGKLGAVSRIDAVNKAVASSMIRLSEMRGPRRH